jgi:predicted acetyltransferase
MLVVGVGIGTAIRTTLGFTFVVDHVLLLQPKNLKINKYFLILNIQMKGLGLL